MPADKASVSVSPTNPSFGDTVQVEWHMPDNHKGLPVVYVQAFQNGELVMSTGGYPPISSAVLGPTALWPSGAAQGKAKVGTFDGHTGNEKIMDVYEFEISA